ncbi:TetR/AcrR family transcriptional regulator [uncultured Clostridium sp.]|uniref:TetR/AcrR family transcriptional regulator n=1 Tax=uncultured Clostridium sp. TaxID=59620 RepID=UPI0025D3FA0A|nr:TetR/AcrR family transcriptional regulator [uncultured Clostridium sp.]
MNKIVNNNEQKMSRCKINKDKYHHGDLKETMIITGVKLLAQEGAEKFSLRKLASMCDVSHAAPYKHFKNKEELILAIKEYIDERFTEAILEVADKYKNDPMKRITEIGKKYVSFMVENKDYFKLLFFNSSEYKIKVNMNNIENYDYEPFKIFKKCAEEALRFMNSDPIKDGKNILAMWATVHGLASMFTNGIIVYEGNYLELVEQILIGNVSF